jgi:hypothetical protein
MQGQLILTRLLQNYDIAAVPGRTAVPYLSGTLRTKDGVWVSLRKRARL